MYTLASDFLTTLVSIIIPQLKHLHLKEFSLNVLKGLSDVLTTTCLAPLRPEIAERLSRVPLKSDISAVESINYFVTKPSFE